MEVLSMSPGSRSTRRCLLYSCMASKVVGWENWSIYTKFTQMWCNTWVSTHALATCWIFHCDVFYGYFLIAVFANHCSMLTSCKPHYQWGRVSITSTDGLATPGISTKRAPVIGTGNLPWHISKKLTNTSIYNYSKVQVDTRSIRCIMPHCRVSNIPLNFNSTS